MSNTKTFEDLNAAIAAEAPLKDIMKLYTAYILAQNDNNKVRTAKALGMDRRTIQRWAKGQPAFARG